MELKGEDIVLIKEIEVKDEKNYLNYLEIRLKDGNIMKCVPIAAHGYDSWLTFEK